MGDDDNRIGVFLCDCGGTTGAVDMVEVADYCRKQEEVSVVEIFDFLCSGDMEDNLISSIREAGVNALVIGACSPRLYQERFEELAERAGLNRYMVEMANLREHCAWVHTHQPEEATRKAKDLMEMSLSRAREMVPSPHGVIACIDEELCDGCGVCRTVCQANAIEIIPDPEREGKYLSHVLPGACEGCGVCVSACPSGAMDMESFANREVLAQLDAAVEGANGGNSFPHIVVFGCHWCGYAAADTAGIMRIQMDPRFRMIRTLCSARVDPEWILRALSSGADGVMVIGAEPGDCHFEVGSLRTRKRMTLLRNLLNQLGFGEERFRVSWVNRDEPEKLAEEIDSFIHDVEELGPNPLGRAMEEGVTGLRGWWAERAERSL
ncbi:MAG: hydrogenase iron-sulfur subunit [Methanomassiliicoccales archaeon]